MSAVDLLSRRNVLLGLGSATATGAVATGAIHDTGFFQQLVRPTASGRTGVALDTATYDDWTTQVGSEFKAHTGQVLKLVDVQGYPKNGSKPAYVRDQAFVARFDVSKGGAMAEELYTVAHPKGGTFEIFLTRGGPDKPMRMLAVFS